VDDAVYSYCDLWCVQIFVCYLRKKGGRISRQSSFIRRTAADIRNFMGVFYTISTLRFPAGFLVVTNLFYKIPCITLQFPVRFGFILGIDWRISQVLSRENIAAGCV